MSDCIGTHDPFVTCSRCDDGSTEPRSDEPRTAAGREYLAMIESGDPVASAHRSYVLAIEAEAAGRHDPDRLHKYLHDEGVFSSLDDAANERWHQRVCEGAPVGRHDPEAVRRVMLEAADEAATGTKDCECGLDMDAHAGGMALTHHDEHMRGLYAAALARTATDGSSDE
jgi:hypothetical protein